jgi:hypothetical protein
VTATDLVRFERRAAAVRVAGFFARPADFVFLFAAARAFLTIAAPTAVVTAAPTTAAMTPAVRDCVTLRSAFVTGPADVERDVEEVFDFMRVETGVRAHGDPSRRKVPSV